MTTSSQQPRWWLGSFDGSALGSALEPAYRLDEAKPRSRPIELYDSFDHRIRAGGMALLRRGGRFRLVARLDPFAEDAASGRVIRHRRPVFAGDFETGGFRTRLEKLLKIRAACQVARLDFVERVFPVRNGDDKIVLRLCLREIRFNDRGIAMTLHPVPLLGYGAEAEEITAAVAEVLDVVAEPGDPFAPVLEDMEGNGAPLSPKAGVEVRPDLPVREAVGRIAATMIRVARRNEPGAVDDIDTEFIHDYRVAVRKLRSVVSLVKGAYAPEETRRLKEAFAGHARATNRLRDLDVYLLEEATYRELLPDCLRPGLDRMFADFRAERGRELAAVRRRFRSEEYGQEMDAHLAGIEAGSIEPGKRADLPIGEVASREIRRHYRLVRRFGLALDDDSPDEDVHKLRLECKKLRYLLELFAPLFPSSRLAGIVKRLRRLQDVLGEFNDCSVQSESMLAYLDGSGDLDDRSAAAVGGLIAVLHGRKAAARGRVKECFEGFCDGRMRKRFGKLLSATEAPAG